MASSRRRWALTLSLFALACSLALWCLTSPVCRSWPLLLRLASPGFLLLLSISPLVPHLRSRSSRALPSPMPTVVRLQQQQQQQQQQLQQLPQLQQLQQQQHPPSPPQHYGSAASAAMCRQCQAAATGTSSSSSAPAPSTTPPPPLSPLPTPNRRSSPLASSSSSPSRPRTRFAEPGTPTDLPQNLSAPAPALAATLDVAPEDAEDVDLPAQLPRGTTSATIIPLRTEPGDAEPEELEHPRPQPRPREEGWSKTRSALHDPAIPYQQGRTVHFNPRVLCSFLEDPALDLRGAGKEEKSKLWWQSEDYEKFLQVRLDIGKAYKAAAKKLGLDIMQVSSVSTHGDAAYRAMIEAYPGLVGESRRGLGLGRKRQRAKNRDAYIVAVMNEQRRQREAASSNGEAFTLDQDALAEVARKVSRKDLAYARFLANSYFEQDRAGEVEPAPEAPMLLAGGSSLPPEKHGVHLDLPGDELPMEGTGSSHSHQPAAEPEPQPQPKSPTRPGGQQEGGAAARQGQDQEAEEDESELGPGGMVETPSLEVCPGASSSSGGAWYAGGGSNAKKTPKALGRLPPALFEPGPTPMLSPSSAAAAVGAGQVGGPSSAASLGMRREASFCLNDQEADGRVVEKASSASSSKGFGLSRDKLQMAGLNATGHYGRLRRAEEDFGCSDTSGGESEEDLDDVDETADYIARYRQWRSGQATHIGLPHQGQGEASKTHEDLRKEYRAWRLHNMAKAHDEAQRSETEEPESYEGHRFGH